MEAFPDAWTGGKGRGKGQGKGGKGKGGKGKGKDEEISTQRREQLEAQLRALSLGTEDSAVPRVGDRVEVKVMGTDRQELQGRLGEVIGTAPALKAATVRFDTDVSVAWSDLRVVQAARPLPEGYLSFPKTLTGQERKVVHSLAEEMHLLTQSFGMGAERYITAYRQAEGAEMPDIVPGEEERLADVEVSGLELDEVSKAALLGAVVVPEGWVALADRMVICRGSLRRPKQMDHRSVVPELLGQIAALRAGSAASLRVVTVARSCLAGGMAVVHVARSACPCGGRAGAALRGSEPACARGPVAGLNTQSQGGDGANQEEYQPPGVDSQLPCWFRACGTSTAAACGQELEWKPWSKEALMLSGRLKEWPRATAAAGN